ncbi:MAG: glycosyltransferase family 9 protein [Saprospiraceae bacterium]|nr:MAG: glycosyltransferase family 9 protein [Saprospiraceae bacterium]
MKKSIRKILVIRFSSIGDIVLTSPVVRCLKQQLGVEIHFLTKREYLPLMEANPHISKVFTIGKNVSEVMPALKKERYDCIIDLHKNLRSWQVRMGLGVKTLTFGKLNFKKWLLVNFKIDRLPKLHLVERYLKAAEPLGVTNDGHGPDYYLPTEALTASRQLPTEFIAFAIGAAHQTKRLPTAKIVAICHGISQNIVLLGGGAEAAQGDEIVAQSGPHVVNLCGKLSLHESAAVIRDAAAVITHDTGMMHIAAAFKKKILSIWGNTVPSFGMIPYDGSGYENSTIFEVQGLPCRPCSKIGYARCPRGHFRCMNDLETEKIVAAISP